MASPATQTKLLAQAANEMFLAGFEWSIAEQTLRDTAPEYQEEALRKLITPRTLPEGFFVWLRYLVWLDRVMEITAVQLLAVEVEGLLVLRAARNRFQQSHPGCPHCGMPNEAHALRCRECMGEIHR